MASITLSVSDDFKDQLKDFQWINWSEIAREEMIRRVIFENYMKTGTLRDEEWEFCDKMDWHPVDELPLKDEFKKMLEKRKKERFRTVKSVHDLFKE